MHSGILAFVSVLWRPMSVIFILKYYKSVLCAVLWSESDINCQFYDISCPRVHWKIETFLQGVAVKCQLRVHILEMQACARLLVCPCVKCMMCDRNKISTMSHCRT